MTFKIKDGIRVSSVDVFNNSGVLLVNAPTATKLQTSRTISLSGDATGSASFDGSANADIEVTIPGLDTSGGTPTLTGDIIGDIYASNGTSKILENGTNGTDASFIGSVTGNASTASAWQTARTVTFATGDVTGSFSIDGSANVSNVDLTIDSGTVENSMLVNDHFTLATNGTGASFDIQLGDTWNFNEGEGIDITIGTDTITIAGEDASTTNKGIASFSSDNFAVAAGVVTIKDGGVANAELVNSSITIGSDAVSLGTTITDINGLTSLDVDNVTIDGNTISTSNANGDLTLAPNGTGNVVISSGTLAGPATFTIDPAGVGDNTGTVVINGNLTVQGTTTTINSNTVNIGDSIILLNGDETGAPSQNAGIEVERGTSTNVSLVWDEANDQWTLTSNGTNFYRILTTNDEGSGNGLDADTVDGIEGAAITHQGDSVTLTGDVTGSTTVAADGSISISTTIAANSVALGTDTTGNYVATVSAGTGISVTGSGSETAAVTVTLDHLGIEDLVDPNADRILFWDDDAGKAEWLTVGTGLQLSGTTLTTAPSSDTFTTVTATVATTSATAVDSWAISSYRSAKYYVQITQGTDYQFSEVMVIHDGTTTYDTEYAVLETNGPLATITSAINGSNLELRVTMGSATSAAIKIKRVLVEI